MGRRQGGVSEASRFASSRRAKRGRFAYIAQPPAHFQRNVPGRGWLAVFPRCSLDIDIKPVLERSCDF
jgi:hypothetical protein